MPVNVGSESLNACSGCEISILNTGEALLDLLPHLNFVHIPALVDHKYYGQTGDGTSWRFPRLWWASSPAASATPSTSMF